MNRYSAELNGAWEERGVIGSRIEIDGRRITVLWRNEPVLETTFKTEETENGLELRLKSTGMRYAKAVTDYAQVTRITYSDGRLEFVEYFPISGESRTVMTRTENSRYGNYEIVDDVLPQLQGKWKTDNDYMELVIRRDELSMNGRKTRIHVLRSKNPNEPQGQYLIADQDPSVYEWEGLSRFEFDGERITTRMLVCDAPSVRYVFEKVR